MHANEENAPRLPLPKWCFVALGVPTFYMPLVYVTLVASVVGHVTIGWPEQLSRESLRLLGDSALFVTVTMWPIYGAWVLRSKRLARGEKAWWLFVVVFLNMVGMPWFYVFMIRRYLGFEAGTSPRDEAALDVFLARCGINKGELSGRQIDVLRSYCRKHRLAKWSSLPMVLVAALAIYSAAIVFPRTANTVFSDMIPTRTIIIDTAKNSRHEIADDDETLRMHVQIVMMFGACSGVLAITGLSLLVASTLSFWPNLDQRLLVEFLKASDRHKTILRE